MGKYDDIIDLPHHVSVVHPHMSINDRAAQFAPFAALTGFEGSITEAARETNTRIELDELRKEELNEALRMIADRLPTPTEIAVTYFQTDARKPGGTYLTTAGTVKRVDTYEHELVLDNGILIPIDDIFDIDFAEEY